MKDSLSVKNDSTTIISRNVHKMSLSDVNFNKHDQSRDEEDGLSKTRGSIMIRSKSMRDLHQASKVATEASIFLRWMKNLVESFKKSIANKKVLVILYIVLLGNGIILLLALLIGYEDWIPFSIMDINNWIFQIANFLLLLSYTSSDILFLRLVLGAASLFFIIWGFTFNPLPLFDVVLWNYIMGLINIRHAISLFYGMRPISFDHEYHEAIYTSIFDGIMSRKHCKELLDIGLYRELRSNSHFSKVGDNITSLSILIKGKIGVFAHTNQPAPQPNQLDSDLEIGADHDNASVHTNTNTNNYIVRDRHPIKFTQSVSRNESINTVNTNDTKNDVFEEHKNETVTLLGSDDAESHVSTMVSSSPERQLKFVNECLPNHFIDSAEYIMKMYDNDATWKVDLIALENCCYITWPREIVYDFLVAKPELKQQVLGILGIDVTKKLFSQKMLN